MAMKKLCLVAMFLSLFCVMVKAADLPVPDDVISAQTIAIITVDVNELNKDQISKAVEGAIGAPPDPKSLDEMTSMQAKFKAAGGAGLSIVYHADKKIDPTTADKGVVMVVTLAEGGTKEKIVEFMNAANPTFKDTLSPDCPKEMDDCLVFYQKGFKLPAKHADTAEYFTHAFAQIGGKQAISVVIIANDDALKAAGENMKPPDAEMLNALLGGGGICLYTDLGIAADPKLQVMILAPDADGATKVQKAAETAIGALKKDMPPAVTAFANSLTAVAAGTNVQISINIQAFAKAAMELGGAMLGAGK